ncbi:MAG: acyl carrier protein [Candidatus Omnitrophota bacterium]
MSLFAQIQEVVCRQLRVSLEEVKAGTSFVEDLGADSLDSIELIMALEDKFNIEISDEDVEKMNTVDDVVRYMAKKTNRNLDSE